MSFNRFTSAPPGARNPLRVLRVDPGQVIHLRTLSGDYGGLLTHFLRGRSHYCPGEECFPSNHKSETYWKGYAPVEAWDRAASLWIPWVLEITERLELDLRGSFCRAQTWKVSRLPQTGKAKTPVIAELIEENRPDSVPPAFDVVPVLLTLYHVARIRLDVKNPLPPRTLLPPSQGAPPPGFGERRVEERAATAEEWQRLRAAAAANGKPAARNGGPE
jgi:hypothetical protein